MVYMDNNTGKATMKYIQYMFVTDSIEVYADTAEQIKRKAKYHYNNGNTSHGEQWAIRASETMDGAWVDLVTGTIGE